MSAEKKVERLEGRIERLEKRLSALEQKLAGLTAELEERKRYFQTNTGEAK